jgi:hypothetical protein
MKRCIMVLITGVITAILPMTLSCGDPADSVSDSLIQVKMLSYETGELETASYGAVFYDKYHALTVIDYERYNPESIVIITSDNYTYEVSLEAVDSLSGLAILKTQRPMKVPAIAIAGLPNEGDTVLAWEPDKESRLVSYSLNVTSPFYDSLVFQLNTEPLRGPVFSTGSIVSGKNGKLIGLVMPLEKNIYTAIPRPFVAGVADTPNMLSSEYDQKARIDGPVRVDFGSRRRIFSRFLSSLTDYEKLSDVLSEITTTLGEPIAATGIDIDSWDWYSHSLNSAVLLALYPDLIELKDTDGRMLTQARWFAIEWNRDDDQPDRLLYGTVPYTIQGAFELTANLKGFEEFLSGILEWIFN